MADDAPDDRPTKKKGRGRRLLRAGGVLTLLLFLGALVSTERFRACGAAPDAESLARMRASPHFDGNEFTNAEPTTLMKAGSWDSAKHWLFGPEMRTPRCPLPVFADTKRTLASPSKDGLRITWLGHSTSLIEIDGATILTDPNWSERSSPSRWIGPRRFHPPPLPLDDLPRIDAVIVSHEHYDHLDMATVRALGARGLTFHVPLGVGAHLRFWGIPKTQVIEHDWWEKAKIAPDVELVSTPARHFNGRGVPGRTGTSWTSWSMIGPRHRVFFSGDTGLTTGFREIRERCGPFDLAMLEIGQYHEDWGDIHLGPRGALDGFAMLGAKRLLPIHWATFELAYHAWSEPAETLALEAEKRNSLIVTPRLGEPIEPSSAGATSAWWRSFPPMAAACP